jgi:hypothetical protein
VLTNNPPNNIAGKVIKFEILDAVAILSTEVLTMKPSPAAHCPISIKVK